MRKFNPEKELYKIQHGKRNKIIFGVIAILLIIGISSSYALYQIRYTKRIVYNKVNGFSNVTFSKPDNVTISPDKALLLSGETKTFTATLPDNYKIDTVTCTNSDSSIKSDSTFTVTYKTSAASVCTVTIKQKLQTLLDYCSANESLSTCMPKALAANNLIDDDPGKNIRYIGADTEVNNYIWFNCDDYNNLTQTTAAAKCEKWRIIGLFKNIAKANGGTENLVKIIRAESIGKIAWDTTGGRYGSNNWANASLQTSLNTTYYNGTALGSGKGITSTTKNMIEQVTWNIGGLSSAGSGVLASRWYELERGNTVPSGAEATWPGYIALMYPSDYGYATGGGSMGRDACLAKDLSNWDSRNYKTDCPKNSWLYSGTNQWTLTPYSSYSDSVFTVYNPGDVTNYTASSTAYAVRPSLYLKSDVQIANGKGTSGEPYIPKVA